MQKFTFTKRNSWGRWELAGVPGFYEHTPATGNWSKLYYCRMNSDGIGLAVNEYLGSVSMGNYGGGGIAPARNPEWRHQVETKILAHAERLHAPA